MTNPNQDLKSYRINKKSDTYIKIFSFQLELVGISCINSLGVILAIFLVRPDEVGPADAIAVDDVVGVFHHVERRGRRARQDPCVT